MTTLDAMVRIDRRFARSARIDADLKGTPPLVGYVMQASTAKALMTLAAAQAEAGQGAFTWTGPYGGGKSSAALLVGNLVGGKGEARDIAREIAGPALTDAFAAAFPENHGPWTVVPVTGSRDSLRTVIADACRGALGWKKAVYDRAIGADDALIEEILRSAVQVRSGVLIFLDELGKLLEYAAGGGDVHLLQDIAERASRSEGRLVVVGILHQSFDQYAARAGRDARDEWVKVQGRYQDISFLTATDESVALLARAIQCDGRPATAAEAAQRVASAVGRRRPTDEGALAEALAFTWPLNPVTALLLGPVSRQRFAQNERSVFGFLSSAEPYGFQAYLAQTAAEAASPTYGPDLLWDYLAANFGMALTAGADGARFSLAFEAIDRAAAKGTPLHVALTKASAVIEFFRNGSGLAVALDCLMEAAPQAPEGAVQAAVADLVEWAILIEQPRLGGYALFAGSDFDLEDAIARAMDAQALDAEQLARLPERVGLGFAAAKRHYFATGALRTFELSVQLVSHGDGVKTLVERVQARKVRGSGVLVLLVSDGDVGAERLKALARDTARALKEKGVVAAIASAPDSPGLRSEAADLLAIERVLRDHPRLEGDRIARREAAARHSMGVDGLQRRLEAALDNAAWWLAPEPDTSLREPMAVVCSALADAAFPDAPVLKSELLQRDRPSSNAMAAMRDLCHRMVLNTAEKDLGFEGYPAAMGLYLTVLEPFGLHRVTTNETYDFFSPEPDGPGATLEPAWRSMEAEREITLADVYATWARPPIGMKTGVMPVLALANIMARRDRLALYVDGVFQTELNDVFVDRLLQKPGEIRLRRIERSDREAAFLEGLARRFEVEAPATSLVIAQVVFRRFESLPIYAQRSAHLSDLSRKVRDVVLKANDPEALLFDALPEALDDALSAEVVHKAALEAEKAYPALLDQLVDRLADAVGTDVATFTGVAERYQTIRGLTNDWAFDALGMRAAAFETGERDIEGLAGLLLHKGPEGWSDGDAEQAFVELMRLGRRFRELEAVAEVRGRPSGAEGMAVVVGLRPKDDPLIRSFNLSRHEQVIASDLASQILALFAGRDGAGDVKFAALARAAEALVREETPA
jgi:hypothetical protein